MNKKIKILAKRLDNALDEFIEEYKKDPKCTASVVFGMWNEDEPRVAVVGPSIPVRGLISELQSRLEKSQGAHKGVLSGKLISSGDGKMGEIAACGLPVNEDNIDKILEIVKTMKGLEKKDEKKNTKSD